MNNTDKNKNNIDRRGFLKMFGTGAAAASAVALTGCAPKGNTTQGGASGIEPAGTMTYRKNRHGEDVSLLGYGFMRLPTIDGGSAREAPAEIDQEMVNRETDYALAHGVNYFDTSPAYTRGLSEKALGIALSRHKRDEFYVATKLSNFHPGTWSRKASREMYHNSFKELQVDYIDYMLLHGIGMGGMEAFNGRYIDNGMLDFLLKERKKGKIRNLGFSYHGDVTVFDHLLSCGIEWDFVQIQMNYVDWKHAKEVNPRNTNAEYLYDELHRRGIPVVIMEPLLGGRLANINHISSSILSEMDPQASAASWAFRFVGSHPGVMTVLSGMTYMEHLQENVRTFSPLKELSEHEYDKLEQAALAILKFPLVQCNTCQYCMPCPYGLDIPGIFSHYNKCLNEGNAPMDTQDENYKRERRAFLVGYDRSVPRLRQASHCIGCRQCVEHCPQRINIPAEMHRIDRYVEELKRADTDLGTAAIMAGLIKTIDEGNYSCVIYNHGETTTYNQSGVKDLFNLVTKHPDVLRGALMVDKVVGKGAASLMILGGVIEMNTRIISVTALDLLRKAGVKVSYEQAVDHIINRAKTDWCPLEKRVRDCATAEEAFPIIEGFIDDLNNGRPL